MSTYVQITKHYNEMKACVESDSAATSESLNNLARHCHKYLSLCEKVDLISKVPYKEYFSFSKGIKTSRAIRRDIFTDDISLIENFLSALIANNFTSISAAEIDIAAYTIAVGFCAIVDMEKEGDQKTTGTFFEYFIGHCFAKRLLVNPRSKVAVLNLDRETNLPTDLIFDLGPNKPKFHVPIKISTRERVIQVWAHQRVLDGVYGTGRFYGTLACLSETKTDKKKREVVEICLPQQWQLYQMFIAQMKRVYYLDLPLAYSKLNDVFPKIHVKTLSSFFLETEDLRNFD